MHLILVNMQNSCKQVNRHKCQVDLFTYLLVHYCKIILIVLCGIYYGAKLKVKKFNILFYHKKFL